MARLDIVSRSFNRRRDAPTIFAIVSQRFFDGGQLVPPDLEEAIIGKASEFSKLLILAIILFLKIPPLLFLRRKSSIFYSSVIQTVTERSKIKH